MCVCARAIIVSIIPIISFPDLICFFLFKNIGWTIMILFLCQFDRLVKLIMTNFVFIFGEIVWVTTRY